MEVGHGDLPFASGTDEFDFGVEGRQGDRHVGGMGGHAVRGVAEHGVVAVDAVEGPATGARFALVAGLPGVLEVRAAGPLEEVAPGGGHVAELARRAGQQGLGQDGQVAAHRRMRGEVAVAHGRPDPEPAAGQFADGVEGQPADVDEGAGGLHTEFHEVDEIGTAAEEAGVRQREEVVHGVLGAAGPDVTERLHAITSATASTIRG